MGHRFLLSDVDIICDMWLKTRVDEAMVTKVNDDKKDVKEQEGYA